MLLTRFPEKGISGYIAHGLIVQALTVAELVACVGLVGYVLGEVHVAGSFFRARG